MVSLGRFLTTSRAAIALALVAPPAAAAILLPFRAAWSNTNVALLLVVVVVAVAAVGNRAAGALAAVSAFAWFDFFFTLPYYRFSIRSSSRRHDRGLAASHGPGGVATRGPRPAPARGRDHGRGLPDPDPPGGRAQPDGKLALRGHRPGEGTAHRNTGAGWVPLRVRVARRSSRPAGARRHRSPGTPSLGRRPVRPAQRGNRAPRLRQRPVLRAVHADAQTRLGAIPAGAPGRRHARGPGRAGAQLERGHSSD